ncbi:hypothetical protein BGZ57DRAFT_945022 [Hyaloscypha finlandica]|nr:hypothetical protein BGZ57DRAFT_945022 [Hyaloscypha finlandica]
MHEALDTASASDVDNNPDFKDISGLRGAESPESPNQLPAWTLDKYEFLHVLEKTWAMKSDMDWYVIIDADSYIFWAAVHDIVVTHRGTAARWDSNIRGRCCGDLVLSLAFNEDAVEYAFWSRDPGGLLTHAEIFRNLVTSSIEPNRRNWDNLASDPGEFGKTGGLLQAPTFEECRRARDMAEWLEPDPAE